MENTADSEEIKSLPRFIFKFQDEVTGFTKAVGTDDIEGFLSTDLRKFIRYCRTQVQELEGKVMQAKAKGQEL